jgi:hypothetical protein
MRLGDLRLSGMKAAGEDGMTFARMQPHEFEPDLARRL